MARSKLRSHATVTLVLALLFTSASSLTLPPVDSLATSLQSNSSSSILPTAASNTSLSTTAWPPVPYYFITATEPPLINTIIRYGENTRPKYTTSHLRPLFFNLKDELYTNYPPVFRLINPEISVESGKVKFWCRSQGAGIKVLDTYFILDKLEQLSVEWGLKEIEAASVKVGSGGPGGEGVIVGWWSLTFS